MEGEQEGGQDKKEGKKERQCEFNIQEEREENLGPHRGPRFLYFIYFVF